MRFNPNTALINLVCLAFSWFHLGNVASGGESLIAWAPLSPEMVAVPQNLLKLAHAKEVQQELSVSSDQLLKLEMLLRDIDSKWWPARILPIAEQRKITASLEQKLLQELPKIAGGAAVDRLRQIELQSQGARVLVRPEIAKHIRLDSEQLKKFVDLFAETDKLVSETNGKSVETDKEKFLAAAEAQKNEPTKAMGILKADQFERLRTAMGKTFETSKLERIYPLAPELVDSGYWVSTDHPTLQSLRGQVVLVHFYAFQCHNCVANFGHYKRWDESLRKKGVRLIGIQTPETEAERSPEKVIGAAKKEGFQFPVLIDVQSKNWAVWGNTMWPTVYVIDKKGYIRFWWQGELNWQGATVDQRIEKVVEQLLSED